MKRIREELEREPSAMLIIENDRLKRDMEKSKATNDILKQDLKEAKEQVDYLTKEILEMYNENRILKRMFFESQYSNERKMKKMWHMFKK